MIERGAEWEFQTPEDAVLVSDAEGIMTPGGARRGQSDDPTETDEDPEDVEAFASEEEEAFA